MGAAASYPIENRPPSSTEVEVSLFGPGVGECVVVHLGGGEWLVVDSCSRKPGGSPIAIEYLERLGVAPDTALKAIVATHWHDDHVGGMATLVQEAKAARFFCSNALKCEDFLTLVEAHGRPDIHLGLGVDEFAKILRVLERRGPTGRLRSATGPEWAHASTVLFRRPAAAGVPEAEVIALSPSSASLTLSLRELNALLPKEGDIRRRLPSRSPNDFSIVLWLRIGKASVLLGGDLERSEDPRRGWRAVVGFRERSGGKAIVFKVPHHGSVSSDDPAVWSQLLAENPTAVLTPHARGRTPLPTPADVNRLRERTTRLYSTGDPKRWKTPRRLPAVERTIREVLVRRQVLRGRMGQIRIRWNAEDEVGPMVSLSEGAVNLG